MNCPLVFNLIPIDDSKNYIPKRFNRKLRRWKQVPSIAIYLSESQVHKFPRQENVLLTTYDIPQQTKHPDDTF